MNWKGSLGLGFGNSSRRYMLVAIIKKELQLDVSLHALLQILSLTLFEKLPLQQALAGVEQIPNDANSHNQLKLFDL